jgi:hypothetical protein
MARGCSKYQSGPPLKRLKRHQPWEEKERKFIEVYWKEEKKKYRSSDLKI